MRRLLKNGAVINVFTDEIEKADVLIENDIIIGVGDYGDAEADISEDMSDKYICPGFIDGHIHIESTMLQPSEFARVCAAHGTTAVIADPHEIVNVAGVMGMEYMLEATENLPVSVYFMVPSCVPATGFDESGASIDAEDIKSLLRYPRVLGLGEMMNYPGAVAGDENVLGKIGETVKAGMMINGHAPMLSGIDLDKYISLGIYDDHECSTLEEALEKLRKGQCIMIRQGTASRNLEALLPLFDEPYSRRCILVTDDKEAADLIRGHIDSIIREAVSAGKSAITGIRMATIQAAEHFGLRNTGAIAPGYKADIAVLDSLETMSVSAVYKNGRKVAANGRTDPDAMPDTGRQNLDGVISSVNMPDITENDFFIEPESDTCRVIEIIPGQIITKSSSAKLDFVSNNGISIENDIIKLAVLERHRNTGHKGIGFISGIGLRRGAIASSVAHDSHNIIVIGTNHRDMAAAANRLKEIGGGKVVAENGAVTAELPLPIGGLMSGMSAEEMKVRNEHIRNAVRKLGTYENVEPFMNMSFLSLPVIPELKLTTKGLVDVNAQKAVSLFI